MTKDSHIDKELLGGDDTRNVVDGYKYWKVSAIKADLAKRTFPVQIAIENFQHDYNIGSIVRSANACNVSAVHIIGKKHWNRRGAMATEKYLHLQQHPTREAFLDWYDQKASSYTLIGVDNVDNSVNLSDAQLPEKSLFVFGQEGPGLSVEMQRACAYLIAIEQFGSTRSVNVGVAGGIVMYEWLRRNVLTNS